MIPDSTPALLLAELHLPPGFVIVDPADEPPRLEDGLRVEIMDEGGAIRPWTWSDLVDWHGAIACRIISNGRDLPCDGCGTLTQWAIRDPETKRQVPYCKACREDD